MKIAVTDANIFIDLIKLQWLGYLFNMNVEIYTTREVIDELNTDQLERVTSFIQSGQLNVHNFNVEELQQIGAMNAPASLTIEDKSVVYLAKKLRIGVLTGDNSLKRFCQIEQLVIKGIIWLFDRFITLELVSCETAIKKMQLLMSFNNRLPTADCQARLITWSEMM